MSFEGREQISAQDSLRTPSEPLRTDAALSRNAGQSSVGAQTSAASGPVELHIGELVLDGFAHIDRYSVGEAVERELTRLFMEQGVPRVLAESLELDQSNAGAIQLWPDASPREVGAQIARAIYGVFGDE